MSRRKLLRGGIVLTMDPALGDFREGDVLLEEDRIAAVGPRIEAPDAEVLDCARCIVLPGLVNAHLHTWQTALRGVASDWTLPEYLRNMHAGLATVFEPDDLYIATLMGALNQLNGGTTTLADWCHNNPTPEHTDAAIEGLDAAGIRAVFFHGSPKPDPKPGMPAFWEIPHPRHEILRLRRGRFAGTQGRLGLAMAILGPHFSTWEVAEHDFRLAHELDLVASMHNAGPPARTPGAFARLEQQGLLGPNINIVHGQGLDPLELARLIDCGVSFSLAPEGEMTQGHGFALSGAILRLGGLPSLGSDLDSLAGGEMLTVARIALGLQRALDNDASRRASTELPPTSTLSCRQALEWITVGGARMLRMEHRIGTLTPGKQADVVVIRAGDLNLWPVHDPYASVVMHASLANIDTVIVGGELRKAGGRLLHAGIRALQDRLADSGVGLLERSRARAAGQLGH
jgi:5-methylthioadenosine/S-adenosylhomocysteine deaminase